ncbi:MAG: hypothetical protein KBS55_01390 [Bacteroidales bacterium]|nr:hypothetical protein [Candidatus Cryptobacteroides aphodequi]
MEFKRFFAGLVAVSAAVCAFVGCEPNEALGEPEVTLSEKTITLEAGEDSATIELTSTLDWTLKDYESVRSWLTVSPASGKASNDPQKITISATANEGKERTAEIVFYGNKLKQAKLSIKQAGTIGSGDGSRENPYSASEANAFVSTLAADTPTEQAYYIQGVVKKFHKDHESGMTKFGNASFWISDDASGEGDDFLCFQVYGPGNQKFTSLDQIALGDTVIVCSTLVNYAGNTPETTGKGSGFVYAINGVSDGTGPGPIVPITGDNLLTTGGFEVWNNGKPEGWAGLAASNADIKQSATAHSGSYSVEITNSTTSNKRFHSDPILLKAGTYQFSIQLKGTGAYRLGYVASWNADGTVNGGNMGANYMYLCDKTAISADWTEALVQFTLKEDSKVSLFITAAKSSSNDFFADDAVLATRDGGIAEGVDDGGAGDDGGDTPVEMPYDALDLNNFVEGYYVIAYTTGGKTYLMKNEVKAQYYVAAEEFDLANSTSEDFAEDVVFYIAEGEEGYIIENMDGGYVACQVSGTHYNLVPSVENPYEWNFANGTNGAIIATGANSNNNCISYNAQYTEYNMYSKTTSCPTFYLIQEGGGEGGVETCADAYYLLANDKYMWELNLYDVDYDAMEVLYPDVYLDFAATVGQDSTCIAGSYDLTYGIMYVNEEDMEGIDLTEGTIEIAVVTEGDDYYYPVYDIKVEATFEGGVEYKVEYEIPIYAYSYQDVDEEGYPIEFYLDDKLAQKTKAFAAHSSVNRGFNAHKLMPAKPVRTR